MIFSDVGDFQKSVYFMDLVNLIQICIWMYLVIAIGDEMGQGSSRSCIVRNPNLPQPLSVSPSLYSLLSWCATRCSIGKHDAETKFVSVGKEFEGQALSGDGITSHKMWRHPDTSLLSSTISSSMCFSCFFSDYFSSIH